MKIKNILITIALLSLTTLIFAQPKTNYRINNLQISKELKTDLHTWFDTDNILIKKSVDSLFTANDIVLNHARSKEVFLDSLCTKLSTKLPVNMNKTKQYNHNNNSGTIHVKGYYRKNGTYVKPHTRHKSKKR